MYICLRIYTKTCLHISSYMHIYADVRLRLKPIHFEMLWHVIYVNSIENEIPFIWITFFSKIFSKTIKRTRTYTHIYVHA